MLNYIAFLKIHLAATIFYTRLFNINIRPDGVLIAVWVAEVETSAAGEREYGFYDWSASGLDFCLGLLQVFAVEDDERTAVVCGNGLIGSEKSAIDTTIIREGYVVGAVIGEWPAEDGGEK